MLTAQQVVTQVINRGPTTGTGRGAVRMSQEGETQPPTQTEAVGVGENAEVEGVAGRDSHKGRANTIILLQEAGLIQWASHIMEEKGASAAQSRGPPMLAPVVRLAVGDRIQATRPALIWLKVRAKQATEGGRKPGGA